MIIFDYWLATVTGKYYAMPRFYSLLNGGRAKGAFSIRGLTARVFQSLFVGCTCDSGPGSKDWALDYVYPDKE